MFSNPLQNFLSIGYDWQSKFRWHVRKICQSMSRRNNTFRPLACLNCGWHTSDHRQVNIAVVRSVLEYAAAAWLPWLSTTTTKKHERLQLEVSGTIIGLFRSNPVEEFLAESKLALLQRAFKPSLS